GACGRRARRLRVRRLPVPRYPLQAPLRRRPGDGRLRQPLLPRQEPVTIRSAPPRARSSGLAAATRAGPPGGHEEVASAVAAPAAGGAPEGHAPPRARSSGLAAATRGGPPEGHEEDDSARATERVDDRVAAARIGLDSRAAPRRRG